MFQSLLFCDSYLLGGAGGDDPSGFCCGSDAEEDPADGPGSPLFGSGAEARPDVESMGVMIARDFCQFFYQVTLKTFRTNKSAVLISAQVAVTILVKEKKDGAADFWFLYEFVRIVPGERDRVMSFFIGEKERVFRKKKDERERERMCVFVLS